jgi:hypothetical protein
MKKLLVTATLAALLAACAGNPFNGYAVEPGTPRDAVVSRLGRPTRVVPLPAGERLQYSLQPMGQYAWMVDFDSAGRALRSRQVLTLNEFSRIEPGQWNRADVEREFGPPAMMDGVASWNGPIMTYRWYDGSDMFYHVYLDQGGVVRRAHQAMEFRGSRDIRD